MIYCQRMCATVCGKFQPACQEAMSWYMDASDFLFWVWFLIGAYFVGKYAFETFLEDAQ